jgi:hypothetical protein
MTPSKMPVRPLTEKPISRKPTAKRAFNHGGSRKCKEKVGAMGENLIL